MPGLVPGIQVRVEAWIAGTSPAMTDEMNLNNPALERGCHAGESWMHIAFDFLAVAAVIGALCAISLQAPRS
jgi:hypothetical protein